jgi:hypothetical protein
MTTPLNKPLSEQANDAVLAAVKKEAPKTLRVDVNLQEAAVSINTTKAKWTLTAYAKKAWKGAFSTGLRVERPLSLLSRPYDQSKS